MAAIAVRIFAAAAVGALGAVAYKATQKKVRKSSRTYILVVVALTYRDSFVLLLASR